MRLYPAGPAGSAYVRRQLPQPLPSPCQASCTGAAPVLAAWLAGHPFAGDSQEIRIFLLIKDQGEKSTNL